MIDAHLTKKDETPQSVFNPLRVDFIDKIRDDNNVIREYKVRSMEIETFPAYIATHIVKHLITAVQNERHILGTDLKALEDIRKEVIVNEV
jgi:hypothetical protein